MQSINLAEHKQKKHDKKNKKDEEDNMKEG